MLIYSQPLPQPTLPRAQRCLHGHNLNYIKPLLVEDFTLEIPFLPENTIILQHPSLCRAQFT